MKLQIKSFDDGAYIPHEHAFCVPASRQHVTMGQNRNPHLLWSDAPDETQSYAIIVYDPDVPTNGDDVNKVGREVPKDLLRMEFYHFVLVDIPPHITEIEDGEDSNGITKRGKPIGNTEIGRRGYNSYTDLFKGDEKMEGVYGGYDGPCPPWNDSIIHRYIFTVYALDVEYLGLGETFGGDDVLEAMEGHIIDQAEWIGKYTLNKRLF